MTNPFLGIFYHAVGGFAAGSFYLPIEKVKKWSWESSWLVNGFFAWLIIPISVSVITVPETFEIIASTPTNTLLWTYFFGLLWGVGGLSFGLALRYLGISLGMALALGLTSAFGTLIPPIYEGRFGEITGTSSGLLVLSGVLISFIGIGVCGYAGFLRDKSAKKTSKKFNLFKGSLVAVFAGIMSSSFAFGIEAGKPIAELAVTLGAPDLWKNGPIFIVILLGGLTVNLLWCLRLNILNGSISDYKNTKAPLFKNYLFAATAGTIWYCQFMFYGIGSTKMGEDDFASWTLHMVYIILFSSLLGFLTKEWRGTSYKTKFFLALGLSILVISTLIIGLNNFLISHFKFLNN